MVMVLCNLKAAIHNITASNSTVDNERVSLGVGCMFLQNVSNYLPAAMARWHSREESSQR